jgi:hypothetical protein
VIWWRIEDSTPTEPVEPAPDVRAVEPEGMSIPQINQGVHRERPRPPRVTLDDLMADPSRWVGGRARW